LGWSSVRGNEELFVTLKNIIETRGHIDIPSQGYSMYPLIRTGDLCRFVPLRGRQARVGDILLVLSPSGAFVGHRLHKIVDGGETFVLKGDSNLNLDSPVHASHVLGRMAGIRRRAVLSTRAYDVVGLIWGRLLIWFPFVSVLIHTYLRTIRNSP
jgi:signal peptidase